MGAARARVQFPYRSRRSRSPRAAVVRIRAAVGDGGRRERRAPLVQVPEGTDPMELAAAVEPSESIEDLVARRDLTRVVERVMARLPEEQRTAIVLKEYHGLTFQEIADLLDCPLSTVKTRLYQGLGVLRKQLAHAGVESVFGSGPRS